MKTLLALRPHARVLLLAAGLATAFAVARGQLAFDQPERHVTANPDETSLALEFPFRNTGRSVVTIKVVRTCCGCTAADFPKRTFAPGESGVVTLEFLYADLTGHQRKTVYVDTDAADAAPTALTLDVTIPERMVVAPRLLTWRRGTEPSAQTVAITVAPGEALRPTSVSCEPADVFRAELRPLAGDPQRYEVTVTPLATARPAQAMLTVHTDRPAGRAHRFRAALVVR
ncbi:MAG: DUF1573 domain-containing protein [Opitutae bacterium]|nr:DUF1573 domain-containing protein [Opitutae bacterium]